MYACAGANPDLQLWGKNYITGIWGQSPQWSPGAKPLVRGQRNEADDIFIFQRLLSKQSNHRTWGNLD